jgi:hypothetical protein
MNKGRQGYKQPTPEEIRRKLEMLRFEQIRANRNLADVEWRKKGVPRKGTGIVNRPPGG